LMNSDGENNEHRGALGVDAAGAPFVGRRWNRLLAKPPREFFWPSSGGNSSWHCDTDIERLMGSCPGQGYLSAGRIEAETFTIRAEPARGDARALILEWEKTRVRVPVKAGK